MIQKKKTTARASICEVSETKEKHGGKRNGAYHSTPFLEGLYGQVEESYSTRSRLVARLLYSRFSIIHRQQMLSLLVHSRCSRRRTTMVVDLRDSRSVCGKKWQRIQMCSEQTAENVLHI